MTLDDVISRIEPIIRDLFDEYEGPVTADLAARDVEQWDSLANVHLAVMIEKEFRELGVRFSSGEIGAARNLGEFAQSILSRVK